MRVGKLISLIGCLIVLGGCTNNNVVDESIEDELLKTIEEQSVAIDTITGEVDILKNSLSGNEVKIAELEKINAGLQSSLDELIEGKQDGNDSIEPILKTMNLSHDFIEAYIEGDLGQMQSLVSESVSIYDNEIHISYGDDIVKHGVVEDIVGYSLNGYGIMDESVMYHYAVYRDGGVDMTGIFIVNLEYKQLDGLWKLVDVQFDI